MGAERRASHTQARRVCVAHIGLDTEALLLTDLDARVQGVPCRLTFAPVTVLRNTLPESSAKQALRASKRVGAEAVATCSYASRVSVQSNG